MGVTPDTEILALLGAGATDRAVARELHVSRDRIRRLRAAHEIPRPTPEHGTDARWQRGCDCTACHIAHLAAKRGRYVRRGPETVAMPEERSQQLQARARAVQTETAAAATRNRAPWTDEDLAIALDYQHTAAEAARLLGRSLSAVRHIRQRRAARPNVLPHRPRNTEKAPSPSRRMGEGARKGPGFPGPACLGDEHLAGAIPAGEALIRSLTSLSLAELGCPGH